MKENPLKNPRTKFKINKDLSCNSKNVVYLFKCNKCKEIYIGSTQALNTRISLHKSNIYIYIYIYIYTKIVSKKIITSKFQTTLPQKKSWRHTAYTHTYRRNNHMKSQTILTHTHTHTKLPREKERKEGPLY